MLSPSARLQTRMDLKCMLLLSDVSHEHPLLTHPICSSVNDHRKKGTPKFHALAAIHIAPVTRTATKQANLHLSLG